MWLVLSMCGMWGLWGRSGGGRRVFLIGVGGVVAVSRLTSRARRASVGGCSGVVNDAYHSVDCNIQYMPRISAPSLCVSGNRTMTDPVWSGLN